MKTTILRRAIARVQRSARLCLPALALALALGTTVVTPPPPTPETKPAIVPPVRIPQVNWNS